MSWGPVVGAVKRDVPNRDHAAALGLAAAGQVANSHHVMFLDRKHLNAYCRTVSVKYPVLLFVWKWGPGRPRSVPGGHGTLSLAADEEARDWQ